MSTTTDTYNFTLSGKALTATPLNGGDLLLEGMAAVWTIDRENENFDPGSFDHGIKSFLDGTAALCWHHDHKAVLGRVLHLERRPDGLFMRARVDGAIRNDPRLGTIYQQVKNGSIRGASVGGFFHRATKAGRRVIARADLTEISLTAVPVGGHRTTLAVVAGKALAGGYGDPAAGADLALAKLELRALEGDIARARLDLIARH